MELQSFWQYTVQNVLSNLQTTTDRLSAPEAAKRFASAGNKKKEEAQLMKENKRNIKKSNYFFGLHLTNN